jgi:L-gulonolactone oxidase
MLCNLTRSETGVLISDLNERLNAMGLALSNLGSISDQTIGGTTRLLSAFSLAGLLATGSHGTGVGHGIFASAVLDLEIILADCVKIKCSNALNTNLFKAALCSLGALGIILTCTIQCTPAFALDAIQYPLPVKNVLLDIRKLINAAGASFPLISS